jgi:hypothetical protein
VAVASPDNRPGEAEVHPSELQEQIRICIREEQARHMKTFAAEVLQSTYITTYQYPFLLKPPDLPVNFFVSVWSRRLKNQSRA